MIVEILTAFFAFSAVVIGAYLVRHYLFTLTVLRREKRKKQSPAQPNDAYRPTVTILVPAHNEEKVIGKLIEKMAQLDYPKNKLEIIIIDDASTDQTGQIADESAKPYFFIKVLHRSKKTGGKGKAGALNAGLAWSTGDVVMCFDADYLPHEEIVKRLVGGFADPKVGAVQGRPVVLNEPQNLVTRLIALERIGGYRVDQEARDLLGLVPQFGGTVGGFRRQVLEAFGGFDESMLTEDTDLTVQIYLAGYKIRYFGDAECYEEAVSSWRAYWRQRHRWAKGHMQVCFKHAFSVLKSKNLKWKEKIDGLLPLNIYFMPLLTLFSFFAGSALILLGSSVAGFLWVAVPISFYSFVGNYAPFFEVGVGAYLDGRKQTQWLVPMLIFSFFYNMLICAKAFFDLVAGKLIGRSTSDWEKTEHLGSGKSYV